MDADRKGCQGTLAQAGRSSRLTTTRWFELDGSEARSATTLKPARSNIGRVPVNAESGWIASDSGMRTG